MSTTNYDCDQCGKPCTAKTVIYNRYKTHFCSVGCKAAHQRGAKDRAKDERIRELEAEVEQANGLINELKDSVTTLTSERDGWEDEAVAAEQSAERWKSREDALRTECGAQEMRNDKLRALVWVGWTSCLLCLLWALWGQFGRHLPTADPVPVEHSAYLPPTTKPDAGELVVGMQGESRTPHIAYVDSLGVWRDADNGERLEVTKWSRP